MKTGKKGKHPVLRNLAVDILCAGIALVIFALFHHVLPRKQESVGIVIPNPYEVQTEDSGEGENTSGSAGKIDPSMILASAGNTAGTWTVTDGGQSTQITARGRNNNNNRNNGRNGMNSKGGSALTEAGEEEASDEEASDEDETPMTEKFAEHYTDEVIVTENSYSSPDVSITVTEETTAGGRITYYLADIYIRDITAFRSAIAKDTFGSGYRDSIEDMALLNNALIAINGDYYGNTNEGVVIRNGVIYRANPTNCDVCVLYYDGSMRVMPGSSFSVEEAIAEGAWQAWTFGPALLDTDGSVLTSFSSTSRILSANPRTAIGYYEPGHYCMVVVDGRGESAGITLPQLSQLFSDLGCKAAYNLDGGNSSIMVWQDEIINQPSGGGRESSDALLITEVKSYE
ncbi:MAG: phosphodiester glycosidase family protein [Clostridia bacterium]|nr:phosphodiester glycosidase family protein [Clostridia bacterium]